jgi:glucokinase
MIVVGLDIGGTKLRAGLVTTAGELLFVATCPTPSQAGLAAVLDAIRALVTEVIGQANQPIAGLGVAAGGCIDPATGRVVDATPTLPEWAGIELGETLHGWFGAPVVVDNDANAAALGEQWRGAARGINHFVYLAIGTGLGGALVHAGQLIRGRTFHAGEFGRLRPGWGASGCAPADRGTVENRVSGRGLAALANESAGTCRYAEGRDVVAAAAIGEPAAAQALDDLGCDLASVLASLTVVFDPEAFLVGGGLIAGICERFPGWLEGPRRLAGIEASVLQSALGIDAGVIGAARLTLMDGGVSRGVSRESAGRDHVSGTR